MHGVDQTQGSVGGQGALREVSVGDAARRAREALWSPELVLERGVPKFLVRAPAGGDEDVTVLLQAVPSAPRHGGVERRQRASERLLAGVGLKPLVPRKSGE